MLRNFELATTATTATTAPTPRASFLTKPGEQRQPSQLGFCFSAAAAAYVKCNKPMESEKQSNTVYNTHLFVDVYEACISCMTVATVTVYHVLLKWFEVSSELEGSLRWSPAAPASLPRNPDQRSENGAKEEISDTKRKNEMKKKSRLFDFCACFIQIQTAPRLISYGHECGEVI